jgi:hypothetical protein
MLWDVSNCQASESSALWVNSLLKSDGERKTWSNNCKTKEEKELATGTKSKSKKQTPSENLWTLRKSTKSEPNLNNTDIDCWKYLNNHQNYLIFINLSVNIWESIDWLKIIIIWLSCLEKILLIHSLSLTSIRNLSSAIESPFICFFLLTILKSTAGFSSFLSALKTNLDWYPIFIELDGRNSKDRLFFDFLNQFPHYIR